MKKELILQSIGTEIRIICESVFVTLMFIKLLGIATISWWLVCSPIIFLSILSLTLTLMIITVMLLNNERRKRK